MFAGSEDMEAAALRRRGWSISAIARHLDGDSYRMREHRARTEAPTGRRQPRTSRGATTQSPRSHHGHQTPRVGHSEERKWGTSVSGVNRCEPTLQGARSAAVVQAGGRLDDRQVGYDDQPHAV